MGSDDKPPYDAVRLVPVCERFEHDDVPSQFAIELAEQGRQLHGGCIIWGLYRESWLGPEGKWHMNVSGRAAVHALLVELGQVHAQLAEQKRLNVALAERCAGQSELLTKRAAKPGGDS